MPEAWSSPAVMGFQNPDLERYGISSLLIVPLRADGATIGAIAAVRTGPGRPYTEGDQALLERFAVRAALAIRDARQKRSDVAIDAFEALYRTNLDGVLVATTDGQRDQHRTGRIEMHAELSQPGGSTPRRRFLDRCQPWTGGVE